MPTKETPKPVREQWSKRVNLKSCSSQEDIFLLPATSSVCLTRKNEKVEPLSSLFLCLPARRGLKANRGKATKKKRDPMAGRSWPSAREATSRLCLLTSRNTSAIAQHRTNLSSRLPCLCPTRKPPLYKATPQIGKPSRTTWLFSRKKACHFTTAIGASAFLSSLRATRADFPNKKPGPLSLNKKRP